MVSFRVKVLVTYNIKFLSDGILNNVLSRGQLFEDIELSLVVVDSSIKFHALAWNLKLTFS